MRETFDVLFSVAFGSGGLSGEWVAKGLSAGEVRGGNVGDEEAEKEREQDVGPAAWKSRFLEVQRRLWEKEEEVKGLKDRILEAVL